MSAQRYSIPNTWHGRLHQARLDADLSRGELAERVGMSPRRLVHLELEGQGYLTPRERERYLAATGLSEADIATVPGGAWVRGQAQATQDQETTSTARPTPPRRPAGFTAASTTQERPKEETKVYEQKQVLTRTELAALQLRANPFPDRPLGHFRHPALDGIIESCEAAVDEAAMIAIVGPSGSGKSTVLNALRDTLERRSDVLTIDLAAVNRGKINDWVLETAVLEGLKIKQIPVGAEKRSRKVIELLSKRARSGARTVLIGDDFHDASRDLLRSLRRLRESDPRCYLLGVVMCGQEGLGWALGSEELREVGGRTQTLEMPRLGGHTRDRRPLTNYGQAYLAWHFAQVGADVNTYITPEAAASIAETAEYPLWVRNMTVMALKKIAGTGRPVDVALLGRLARG